MLPADFNPAVSDWFASQFAAPTDVQRRAWAAIRARRDTLISAPTGSGKTLAAFLCVIDELVSAGLAGTLADTTTVLYVSPLKALSNDVHRNLQLPLDGVRRELAARLRDDVPIRAAVRTGDTPQIERARMRRQAPHILVTTPESLYILLTSVSGRRMLETVGTVIVDEIHALAGNKRGAHLALSLERLAGLCASPPVRIGLSATTRPIERIAAFLTGPARGPCEIIDAGHARERDLKLELTSAPLEAIMAGEVWTEVYDRLAESCLDHRTTLVFVNTRRMAERVARHLAERLGDEAVTSHHGSLSREHRLAAEQRLKDGELRALVATSSLELGIDIGDVDLVCQLGSPRAVTAFLQRVGRSGHGLGRVPKGRLYPLSRDELVECVALLDCVARGELDRLETCRAPLDVLAQQIVAELAMREWRVDELFARFIAAAPYADLDRTRFVAVVDMLADGFSTHRGRRSAHIFHDRVNGVLRGRRGARLTATTNGGAIPDQFDYDVVLLPAEQPVGTLNEDFAFESLPGDIFQLGNTSYRIVRVASGKVYVEDAAGQPPNIPFWFGEAPGRSDELSAAVSRLRADVDTALAGAAPDAVVESLMAARGLDASAARQLVDYLASARAALGLLPTSDRLVFERFFDETGDTHLVIHSPLGSRINRAFGLALRKRFCRRFNFELQAAALEDSIVLSLGAVHSFALDEVVGYLSSATVRRVLEQATLGAPIFPTYWRWNATIALAVRRFRNGRKTPPQFQRMDAEDLMSTVFPEQLACAENLPGGDIDVPDHPMVAQTMRDCVDVAMDARGLEALLAGIETGRVSVACRDLTEPSPLAQEILGARQYAYLDDAPAEERRTLAVQARRFVSVDQAAELGRLDADAIRRVRTEAWPDPTTPDEMHDALCQMGFVTEAESRPWLPLLEVLAGDGRAARFRLAGGSVVWAAAERLRELELAFADGRTSEGAVALPSGVGTADAALRELTRGRLEALGPVTPAALADAFCMPGDALSVPLLALEQQGVAMRGHFTGTAEEWCDRRLLARIHRYTLKRLRAEIEPVSLAEYQRFLFAWQGVGDERREGVEALAAVLHELQGTLVPAAAWEREVLPARIRDYAPDMIDALSASGAAVWWRPVGGPTSGARPTTIAASPVGLVPREHLQAWRLLADRRRESTDGGALTGPAECVSAVLRESGALFFVELVERCGLLRSQVEEALSELVARGLVTADSFNGLRALLTPQRHRARSARRRRHGRGAAGFDAAGRWSLLPAPAGRGQPDAERDAVEHAARALLRRYGVVARAIVAHEPLAPSWRELAALYRRWEARGEIRGGRFVAPLAGEQFALIEAVSGLRRARRDGARGDWIVLSAADPLHLGGLGSAARRVPAIGAHRVVFRDGVAAAALTGTGIEWLGSITDAEKYRVQALLRRASTSRTRAAGHEVFEA